MADNFTANPGSGGDTFAADEIAGIKHQRVKLQYGADGSATDVSLAAPLPIVERFDSPQHSYVTSAGLTAGANVDLDADNIPGGVTGSLVAVLVGASVPLRADIQIVGGGRVTHATVFTRAGEATMWAPPHKDFLTQAGGAGNNFGVSITNLDVSEAADVYATIFWEEA